MTAYVYLLSNPCMPGIYKIGMTSKTPEIRCRQLYKSSSMPTRFKIEAYWLCEDSLEARDIEILLHEWHGEFRMGESEFFKTDITRLVDVNCVLKDPDFLSDSLKEVIEDNEASIDEIALILEGGSDGRLD